jgi:peptide/nickel transport system substrate-binding protein
MSIDTNKQRYLKKDSIYINQVDYIAWNNARPLFSDKRVRRALAMLVDRPTIIHQVLKDIAKINNTPVAFTQPNYADIPGAPTFDPAGAKKILAEAGWTDSDGDGVLDRTINGKKTPFHFTFLLNSGNEWRKQTALIVGEEMRKVGIKADINATEASVWLENVHSHQFDATVIGLSGNASEDDLYQTWHSSESKNKGSNWYSFINPTVDSLLVLNRTEFDYAKRKEYTKQIETIIMEEQPLDYLWVRPLLVARVDRFDNVEFFRQRPGINFAYWVVRGSGVKPLPDRPSTIMK